MESSGESLGMCEGSNIKVWRKWKGSCQGEGCVGVLLLGKVETKEKEDE